MFIQTEQTPNPATLKFLPGREVVAEGTADFPNAASAVKSPLARRLFEISNVSGVFLGSDFITVSKSDGDWQELKPVILGVLMEHFMSGNPVIEAAHPGAEDVQPGEDADSGLVSQIKELLDTRVRPAVARDGGDIIYHSFSDGVVYLQMQGSCQGCPSSTATLKHGIENLLRHYIPEVTEVRAV
jgi:Fe-S cluster biogenesis protein NfuA